MNENTQVPSFWHTHKNTISAIVFIVFGIAGGNADRLYESLPDVYGVNDLKEETTARFNAIESQVYELQKKDLEFEKIIDVVNKSGVNK